MPALRSVIGTFMVYQDWLETYLLQLFAHPEFYNLSVIIFEVNIVAEQKLALLVTIFLFLKFLLPSNILLSPCPTSVPASLDKRVKLFVVTRYFYLMSVWKSSFWIWIASGETAAILSENSYIPQARYQPHLSDEGCCSEASRFSIKKIWYA